MKSSWQGKLVQVRNEMEKVQSAIIKTKNVQLSDAMEEQWALLDQERQDLEQRVESNAGLNIDDQKEILKKMRDIWLAPRAFWELGNRDMQELLL